MDTSDIREFYIEHHSRCIDIRAGKSQSRRITEVMTGVTMPVLEDYLREILDVAIRPSGEPYSPTMKDLKKSDFGKCFSDDVELKHWAHRYQVAYATYKKILDVANAFTCPSIDSHEIVFGDNLEKIVITRTF